MTNTQNKPVELVPCPKCESADVYIDQMSTLHNRWCGTCADCVYCAETQDTREQAVAAWNTRPASSAVVDALREALAIIDQFRFDSDADVFRLIDDLRATLANTPKPSAGLVDELRRYDCPEACIGKTQYIPISRATLRRILSALEGDRP